MKNFVITLFFGLTLFVHTTVAKGALITDAYTWAGLNIEIIYPDKVTYNTSFDISFSMDNSSLAGADAVAFLTDVWISNTMDISNATWAYDFVSDDPAWNHNYTGNLGDLITPYTCDNSGCDMNLIDPILSASSYTWLWNEFNDQVTWTLQNIIILGDTTFSLTLNDWGIVSDGVFSTDTIVLDPPAPSLVPEPSTIYLLAVGLICLTLLKSRNKKVL